MGLSMRELAFAARFTGCRAHRYRQNRIWICLVATLFWPFSPLSADQSDPRLEPLFTALLNAENFNAGQTIEQRIWQLWTDSGNSTVNSMMRNGIEAMERGEFDLATSQFDAIVALAPNFAEGWNKRATIHYLQNRLVESMRDIHRTLALEPRHFGALSGMGLIFLERDDLLGARDVFKEVLRIYPGSISAQAQIERIEHALRQRLY